MLQHCNPARVGYVVKRYPRYSETFIVNEILAHEAAGIEIEIFSLRPPVDTHFQDAISRVRGSVTYLPQRGGRVSEFWSMLCSAAEELPDFWASISGAIYEDAQTVYQAVALALQVKQRGVTHLHAHFASSAASVAAVASQISGVPLTITAHAKDIFHESVEHDDMRRKLEHAAAVVTVSDYNVSFLREQYGPAAARVERIYNGIDLSRFTYKDGDRHQHRIIAVGRLVEKKGFAYLVDACALLACSGIQLECLIVGSGPDEEQLHERISSLGLQQCVYMLGPRPQSEIITAIQNASVFVAPCVAGSDGNRDGLPTVLLEAMALGTPCISTPVTGIPEVIRHRETGLMVPEADAGALASAIETLLNDSRLASRLAGNARQLIEAEFDIQRNARHQRSLFRATHSLAQAV